MRSILAILIPGLCCSLLTVGLLTILRRVHYYAADLTSTLLFYPAVLIACLAIWSLFGVAAISISPKRPWIQIVAASLLCGSVLTAVANAANDQLFLVIVISATFGLMVAVSVFVGQRLRMEGSVRGALALFVGAVVSYPTPSVFSSSPELRSLPLLSPLVAGLVFGIVAALLACEQWKTRLAYGALVASALYLPYTFIEGVPLIFVLPLFVAIFLIGVLASQRFMTALLTAYKRGHTLIVVL